MQWALTRLALQAARRTWRPKRFQNRRRNPKKSMLKNSTFAASIFQWFGFRFGKVFGRFFGPDIRAESKKLNCVKSQNMGRAHKFFWCSGLATSNTNRTKSMKFVMFSGTTISEGFWRGFGRFSGGPNPWCSHFFWWFFGVNFAARFGRAKNQGKKAAKHQISASWRRVGGGPWALGERQREGFKSLDKILSLALGAGHQEFDDKDPG